MPKLGTAPGSRVSQDGNIIDQQGSPEGREISQVKAAADGRDQPEGAGADRGAPPSWKESEQAL